MSLKANSQEPIAKKRNPWVWIPSLYFIEGIPYVIVMILSGIMYKRMGISNTDIALYTGWLYLPWVIKPFWSPIVDVFKTKRAWVIGMQFLMGVALACVAFTLPGDNFFKYSLAFLWLAAFSSATHDIAADGFYMLALREDQQSFFVGIRSTFYRIAFITCQGLVVIMAGQLEVASGLPAQEFTFTAEQNAPQDASFQAPIFDPNSQQALSLVMPSEQLKLSLNPLSSTDTSHFLKKAQDWNLQHKFYSKEKISKSSKENESWWTSWVSKPVGGFIKRTFGPSEDAVKGGKIRSRVGIAWLYLSQAPPAGEDVIVNISQKGGDKSLTLADAQKRFVFTADNWQSPIAIAVQLDPKQKATATSRFVASSGNVHWAWGISFGVLAALLFLAAIYHKFALPRPDSDRPAGGSDTNVWADMWETFASFFQKKEILAMIAFLLFYRFGEAQLSSIARLILIEARDAGGLGLSTSQYGVAYGTAGVLALVGGGLLGGFLASIHGLKKWLWWMVLAINLPNAVYIYLSYAQPESFGIITAAVAVEQFGYGFGFAAFMLYMIRIAKGPHKTAHFAICTGFMALGMMLPGMWSGWLQELIGYQHFFVWVLIAGIPSLLATWFIPLEDDFGKRKEE